MREGEWGA